MNFKRYNYPKVLPEVISFLVTNKCICRCKHCFNWHETGHGGAIGDAGRRDLSLDEIDRVFKGLGQVGYIYIGGGEPFIRKDLFDIVGTICTHSRPETINISTNGQLVTDTFQTVKKILCRFPDLKLEVKISIDGIGEDHDEIRQRKGAFDKALATYDRLKLLKNRVEHLEVGINTVFSAYNQDKIFDIYNYLAGLSPRPDCLTQLLVRANPREIESKQDLNLERYWQWISMYVRDMLAGKFEKDSLIKIVKIVMYEYINKTIKENKRQIHCYAGISGAVIDNEGNVRPCEHKKPYGNLRENGYDFKKIWHSASAEASRKNTYNNCFCTNEPQWWHPSLLYNKEVMDKGKDLMRKLNL